MNKLFNEVGVNRKEFSDEMLNLYLTVLRNQDQEDKLFADFQGLSTTVKIVENHAQAYDFAITKTGIMAICILGDFNPGKCVLAFVETMEKAREIQPLKVDIEFISMRVYPMGFYEDSEAYRRIEQRQNSQKKEG